MADAASQRRMLKAILALPAPILRLLAGGGAVRVGGRTLDARTQFIAAQGKDAPPLSSLPPEVVRAGTAQGIALLAGKLEPGVDVEALSLPGPGGPVAARAYRHPGQDPAAPLMVFAHYGGGVIGDMDTCEAFCSIIASIARCAVLSVDYRLAPEHRFPAGLEDVLAAYRWARDNCPRFGAPAGHVAIGGDSMGGNFAAIVCQEMRRAGEPQPALQLLIYPAVDVADESPSMTTYADAYPLTTATMIWFMQQYMNPGDAPDDLRLSPGRAADLSGLAPAVVAAAGFDPLLDQGAAYARRLREAGVPVTYRCYDALAHAFTSFTGVVPAADAACREIAGLVRATYLAPAP
jgi:acetyl esterase/lipase